MMGARQIYARGSGRGKMEQDDVAAKYEESGQYSGEM